MTTMESDGGKPPAGLPASLDVRWTGGGVVVLGALGSSSGVGAVVVA